MFEIKEDLTGGSDGPMTSGSMWIDESKVTHVSSIGYSETALKHLGDYIPGWRFSVGIGGISCHFYYVDENICRSWHDALLKFVP